MPAAYSHTAQEPRSVKKPEDSLLLSLNESQSAQFSKPISDNQTIEFAIGFSLAPYVLQNSKGLLGEIITQALSVKGYKAKFHFMTNAEALEYFEKGRADAVAVVKQGMSSGILSDPIVTFNNVAIALADKQYQVTTIDDLSQFSLAGFSNAKHYLGQTFFAMTENHQNYIEIPNQKRQVKALFDGEQDFIVADETIFRFNQNTLIHEFTFDGKYRAKVNFYRLFNPVPYYAAFSKQTHVKIFNEGLSTVTQNGKVTKIYQKYTELLDKY